MLFQQQSLALSLSLNPSEVLPYLIRRAQENADALSGAAEQRNMMLKEVGRRMGVFA